TQVNYNVPIGAPAHVSRDSKAYASVYHRWSSPGDIPASNARLMASAIGMAASKKPQGVVKKKAPKPRWPTRNQEQPEAFGVVPKGRQWAHDETIEQVYPNPRDNKRK
ncbi:MAG: hypothetical protein MN733_08450, partial [Nitrososphaera sp.]|nr:hypothetical protein [Nitrososphaera sp.]